jgi:phosphohistidine swiveling domain-containing protein
VSVRIVPLVEAGGPEHSGGKCHNLAQLARFGFPVPRTVVVEADLYRTLMAGEPAAVAATLSGVTDVERPEVCARLKAVQEALVLARWPPGTALEEALATAGLEGASLAVRSSATVEDSPGHSFAGIHESTLAVRSADVRSAVTTCFASLWSPRAVAYRRRAGFTDSAVACAVAICELVPAKAAGVLFTADPHTGRRDTMRVSAVAGLAENLVAGRVNPSESIVRFASDQLTAVEHPADSPLNRAQLEELAILALRVYWALGDGQEPQDIEWVFDGTRFWIVQARPVTRPGDARPEPVRAFPTIWSNANIKDAVPMVLSTMAWCMVQAAIDNMLFVSLKQTGYPVPSGMQTVRRFGGRAYFDLSLMQWLLYDGLGLLPGELNRSLGGAQPELPLPERRPLRHKLACGWRAFALLRRMRRMEREYTAAAAAHREVVLSVNRLDPGSLSANEIAEHLRAIQQSTVRFQVTFMLANTMAGAWLTALQKKVNELLPEDGFDLAGALLAGAGKVVSAQHGYAMLDLARLAKLEPAARAILSEADSDAWRSLPEGSPFRRAMLQFLEEFGHRAVYEAEIMNPRWAENSRYVLDQIRANMDVEVLDPAPAMKKRAEHGLARFPPWTRWHLKWLARKAAHGAARREGSKSLLAMGLLPCRRLILELGHRLAAREVLALAEDIFELSSVDLRAVMSGSWDGSGARALVRERRARRAEWLEGAPPDCFWIGPAGALEPMGPLGPLPGGLARPVSAPLSGDWLTGIPLSAGVATGVVRLVRHPDEGHRLQPGDVLVAPSTDPGWTPLFLRASAVVMETGGMLSHGAIVAREYGLPAVANIPGVMELLCDGQRVTVDGGRGRVAIEPASAVQG